MTAVNKLRCTQIVNENEREKESLWCKFHKKKTVLKIATETAQRFIVEKSIFFGL